MTAVEGEREQQNSAAPGSAHMTVLVYDPGKGIHELIAPEVISEALERKSLLWIDVTAPGEEDIRLLQREFKLHPLALEEMLAPPERPKCSEYADVYVLVMAAVSQGTQEELRFREVTIYIGKTFLITAHRSPFPEIEECVRRWKENALIQKDNIVAPLYSLLDTIVDGYFPVIDHIAEEIEDLEDHIFAGDTLVQGPEIFSLKKEMLAIRRKVTGQRDALNLLLRQDVSIFPEASLLYLQNVYDHLARLVDSVDTYRDLLSSAMDMHLSVLSNRMNQVMKTLTVISTILMSASLIAGIYGMNFVNMPELHTKYGYYGALIGMVAVAGAFSLYFKKKNWF